MVDWSSIVAPEEEAVKVPVSPDEIAPGLYPREVVVANALVLSLPHSTSKDEPFVEVYVAPAKISVLDAFVGARNEQVVEAFFIT